MKPVFDAVCWDHDGLLVDTEHLFYTATREVFAECGASLTPQCWSTEYLSKGTGTAAIAVALGVSDSQTDEVVAERNRRYREALRAELPLRPGVAETLRTLVQVLPLALVTGSRREEIELVHGRTDFLKFFRVVVTRHDYQSAKPAPDAYREAARRLGVEAGRCLAVEDSERGLAAAVAAGMKCIAVPNYLTANQSFAQAWAVEASVVAIPGKLFPASGATPSPGMPQIG